MKGIPVRKIPFLFVALSVSVCGQLLSQEPEKAPAQSATDFKTQAEKLRQAAILRLDPEGPPVPSEPRISNRYPWKTGIVTTIFWIGNATGDSKGNATSAWDPRWVENFGGFDNPSPAVRHDFIPASFVPKLNPFYIALPYNDLANGGTIKPEAKVVIPWFTENFVGEGSSVCRDRWIAVRNAAGKVCYAQWTDCGPYRTDHWQYVFGNEKPKPNANGGAGLNVSPAVRDYLGLGSSDVTDWKFVDFRDVPKGPWALYGANNHFVQGIQRPEGIGTPPPPPLRNDAQPVVPKVDTAK